MFNNLFSENHAGYEIMWKTECGSVRKATGDNVIRHTRFACWITKATDTRLEFVILIALLWQKWLRERATISI